MHKYSIKVPFKLAVEYLPQLVPFLPSISTSTCYLLMSGIVYTYPVESMAIAYLLQKAW